MKRAINYNFTGTMNPITSYDPDLLNVGSIIRRYAGNNPEDNYIAPANIGLARPMEASTAIPSIYPHVHVVNDNLDYIFLCDNATAAVSRRIVLYEHNKLTSEFIWKGFITLTYPIAGNKTIRGFRVSREFYSDGTVSVSDTTVTGVGTLWNDSRLSVGSRIGFGSTDPTQITAWYEITDISSNTSITIDSSATFSSDTPYVIEDLMVITSTTNATLTNGGLFVAKGLRPELFSPSGTTISAATTDDRQRAVYWLSDANTVTNTTAAGAAIEERTSWTEQNVYVINLTGAKIYKYNIRAALSLSSGKSNDAYVLETGNQAVTGTMSQANNGRIATVGHGPGENILSLYFVTTTRVYRCAVSDIVAGSTTWQSDAMVEIPPGGANTYSATSALSSIEYSSIIDRFFIMTTGSGGVRSYCTRYQTGSDQFDHIFLIDSKQLDQSLADINSVPHPVILALPFSAWIEGRFLYLARIGTTAVNNQLYSLPLAAHQTYAFTTNQYIITPKFDISNANKLYALYVNNIERLGSDTFSLQTEPYRTYYRTSGIADNSGTWTLLNDRKDLSGVSGNDIQFAFTFKIMGTTCIPARLTGLSVVYEDLSTDSHYNPSLNLSSLINRVFAYRQTEDWGGNIPPLRIRLTNADTNVSILDDNTISQSAGVFEYSDDNGVSWNVWDNTQNAVGNFIRYTASSLPASTKIKATILQL